jgi:hypothetical protein
VLNQSANLLLNVALNGKSPIKALEESFKSLVTGTLGSFFAYEIGELYRTKAMSYEMHKLAHASLGAMTGALFSKDPLSDALSGAIGSLAAVTFMEAMVSRDEDIELFNKLSKGDVEKKVLMRLH